MKPDAVDIMVDDVGEIEPCEFFVQMGMLILESRVPSISIKGKQDGLHCPRDVGVWPGHVCESTSLQCNRANQILKQMQTLWRNHVPLCIEVLILPSCQHGRQKSISTGVMPPHEDDGYVLLEQWTIQAVPKKPGETYVTPKNLFQALKSYLHFSQLSSWLSSSQGLKPSCIGYRVSPPAEFCTTTFTQDPKLHVFPIGTVNKAVNFKVWLAYLSRMPEIPEPICYEICENGQPCSFNGNGKSSLSGLNRKRMSRSKSPRPRFEAVFQNIKGSPKLISKSCSSTSGQRPLPSQQSQLASIYETSMSNSNYCRSGAHNHHFNSSSSGNTRFSQDSDCPVDLDSKDDAYGIGFSDYKLCHDGHILRGKKSLINSLANKAPSIVSTSAIECGLSNLKFSSDATATNFQTRKSDKFPLGRVDDRPDILYRMENEDSPVLSPVMIIGDAGRGQFYTFAKTFEANTMTNDLRSNESYTSPLSSSASSSRNLLQAFDKVASNQIMSDPLKAIKKPSMPIDILLKKESYQKQNISFAQMLLKDQYVTDSDNSCSPDIDFFLSETLAKRVEPMNPEEMSECLFKLCNKEHLKSKYNFGSSYSFEKQPCDRVNDMRSLEKTPVSSFIKSQESVGVKKLEDLSSFVLRNRLNQEIECYNVFCDSEISCNKVCDVSNCSRASSPHHHYNESTDKKRPGKVKMSDTTDAICSLSKKSKSCSCFMTNSSEDVSQHYCRWCTRSDQTDLILSETLQVLESIKEQNSLINRKRYKKDTDNCRYEDNPDDQIKNFFKNASRDGTIAERDASLRPVFSVGDDIEHVVFKPSTSHIGSQDDPFHGNSVRSIGIEQNKTIRAAFEEKATVRNVSNDERMVGDDKSMETSNIRKKGQQQQQQQQHQLTLSPSLQFTSSSLTNQITPFSALPKRLQPKTPQDGFLKQPSLLNLLLRPQLKVPPQSTESNCSSHDDDKTPCNNNNNNINGNSNLQQDSPRVPTEKEKAGFRTRVQHSSSMVFNTKTKLPMQSSPVPAKRLSTGCFDYDSSLNTVQAIKNSLSCNNLDDPDDTNDGCSRLKRAFSSSAPASTNCLLGNFEESLINGRIQPAGVIDGFAVDIGASGSFCPPHLNLPCLAFFFSLSEDCAPSPYLGHINLENHSKRGYRVPNKGTVQVTLFNPNKSVVKIFVVTYDVSDMPPNHQTLLRQRTLYMPTPGSPSDVPGAPIYLRYLIHLRFASSKQSKIYLHTDLRLIFARDRFEFDSRIHHYELRSFNEVPENPKYSPRK